MSNRYHEVARQEWGQARRKALLAQLWASLSNKENRLVDFAKLSQRFDLGNASYQGVQMIPLYKIVGSLGRYGDFDRAFFPTNENMRERWEKIARLYLDPSGRGVPPIEVYQVGEGYFVAEGNHRVSVARQLKRNTIEAHVWQYYKPVAGLTPGVDIDALVIEAERRDFMERTHLDELRPYHGIRLTVPGGYPDMLVEIARYQHVLSWIDVIETPYEAAVTAWYDMIYKSIVQLIEEARVLDMFPRRTAADFFIWVRRHHHELETGYGEPVLMEDAVKDIKKQAHSNRFIKPWRMGWGWLKRRLGP
jgi:hypothetical protein